MDYRVSTLVQILGRPGYYLGTHGRVRPGPDVRLPVHKEWFPSPPEILVLDRYHYVYSSESLHCYSV